MRPKYFLKPGELKFLTLQAINNGITNSVAILNAIEYPVYNAFQSNLYLLCKRGYISKAGKKPHTYSLTKKGKEHLANPNLRLDRSNEYFFKRLEALMQDDKEFQRLKEMMAAKAVSMSGSSDYSDTSDIGSTPATTPDMSPADAHKTNEELLAIIASKDEKYEQLVSESQALYKRAKANERELEELDEMDKPKPLSKQAIYRIKLTNFYLQERDGVVDKQFFEDWGNYTCCRLISGSLFQKGAVGILGKNNMEHKYGHVKNKISEKDIEKLNLRILKHSSKSITITGEGLVQDVVMVFRTAPTKKRKTHPQNKNIH